nr:hypothetical protein Iba_chr03aCG2790 [Ipomoea batatas]
MECFAICLRVHHCVSWVIAWSYSPLTPAQAGATRGRPCCDEGKASSVDLLVYWKRTQTRIGDKNHQSLKRGTPNSEPLQSLHVMLYWGMKQTLKYDLTTFTFNAY